MILTFQADVAELADATDSKSVARKGVWVRPPPSAFQSERFHVEFLAAAF
jgi:hypothetical protein